MGKSLWKPQMLQQHVVIFFFLLHFLADTAVWLNTMSQKDPKTTWIKYRNESVLLTAKLTGFESVGRLNAGRCSGGTDPEEEEARSSRSSWGNVANVQTTWCPVCLRPHTSGSQLELASPSRPVSGALLLLCSTHIFCIRAPRRSRAWW